MRIVGVAVAAHGYRRAFIHNPLRTAPIDRQYVVLARLDVPLGDHLDQLGAVLGGEVVILGKILVHVVQLPVVGVQFGQFLGRDRISKTSTRLGERRAGPGSDCSPAIVVERTMAQHLEILGFMLAGRLSILKGLGKADAFEWVPGRRP